MPELPEVETVRRDLASSVAGARVVSVLVTGARSVRRRPSSFAAGVEGQEFVGFRRWGKYLLIDLSGGSVLVAHLRMSGQLLLVGQDALSMPSLPHTHVVLGLGDGRELRFVDPRTFGELFVTGPDLPELAGMGPDALAVSASDLSSMLRGRRARLKPALLDQRLVAGIGNIYSDEILWQARLRWSRPIGELRPVEVRRLHSSMASVLADAVAACGSSLGDGQYVDVSGVGGGYQESHAVYGRAGLPCLRCGWPIERVVVAQRSHHWCRRCQR